MNGYVQCQTCRRDVPEISKATAPEFQYCPDHRPWNHKAQEREAAKAEFFQSKRIEKETQSTLF